MHQFKNSAFQSSNSGSGFNLVTQTSNFSSMFDLTPLDESESLKIEKLLVDNYLPSNLSESQVTDDISELKRLTAEVKAIGRQSVILMGERVSLAGELLKPYKDGTFTKWLESTFGSRKTGYNALGYYNLYQELPQDLRSKLKKMPQKSAYMLASRKNADFEKKAEIVSEYYDMSHKDLALLIQEKIPVDAKDKRSRKTSNEKIIDGIFKSLEKLEARKSDLSEGDKEALMELIPLISSLSE